MSAGRLAQAATPLQLLAYGALGLPLAFAVLPIYVHVPKLYADSLGLPLALVGASLLAVRVFDALTDPLLGWAGDRWGRRSLWVYGALPVLAAGMLALLMPPAGAGAGWMAGALALVTLAWSAASIAYHAWGAELAVAPAQRAHVTASREGWALVGVVLAAVLPPLLSADEAQGLARLAWLFLPLLMVCAGLTHVYAPPAPARTGARAPAGVWAVMRAALAWRPFRRLLAVFAANGIAAAVPSVTVLFFVADVVQAPAAAGAFLMLYFLAAALGLPVWVRLAARLGKARAWGLGMALAIVVFGWAWTLGAGDLAAYAAICVLSGFALGADLALPPAMLADLLARRVAQPAGVHDSPAGAWFGCWNFVSKANLALAAGLALPLLDGLGYAPGVRAPAALAALSAVYALLPVVLKMAALMLLLRWRHELDRDGQGEKR